MPHAPIGVHSIGDRPDRRQPAHRRLDHPSLHNDLAAGRGSRSTAVLAVSVLFCERVLAQLDGRREDNLLQIVSACWAQCPMRRNGPTASSARPLPG